MLTDAEIQDIADGFDIYGAKPEFARAVESVVLARLPAASDAEPVAIPAVLRYSVFGVPYITATTDEQSNEIAKWGKEGTPVFVSPTTPTIRNSLTVGDSVIRNSRIACDGEAGAVPALVQARMKDGPQSGRWFEIEPTDEWEFASTHEVRKLYAAPPEKQTS
ncbi:hypothetical protein CEY04_30670, partial [Achromobacter sp. HZ28]